jgi:predicted acylesterase/phospholipase RssA
VPIGDEVYIDGGIVDPLPTDVLREMGVQKIVAVNAIPTPDRIRFCQQAERELARQTPKLARKLIRKLLPANQYVNHYAHGNILEILMHSTHGAQMRVAGAGARLADVVLHPDICDDRWLDFRNPGQYIRAGREIALQHLDEIKTLIKEKGAPHEHESSPLSLATTA